jgi:hypothetical protein
MRTITVAICFAVVAVTSVHAGSDGAKFKVANKLKHSVTVFAMAYTATGKDKLVDICHLPVDGWCWLKLADRYSALAFVGTKACTRHFTVASRTAQVFIGPEVNFPEWSMAVDDGASVPCNK